MRDRLKEGMFGYDYSQLLALQLEMYEQTPNQISNEEEKKLSEILLQKLNTQTQPKNLSFEEWKRRKDTEDRIRKKLIIQAIEEKYEQKFKEANEHYLMQEKAQQSVVEWHYRKMKEAQQKKKESMFSQTTQLKQQEDKKRVASEEYKYWLLKSLKNLKQQQKQQKQQKKKEKQLKAQQAKLAEERKQEAQQAFKEWLKHKNRHQTSRSKRSSRQTRPKKPVMLAYSPNRRRESLMSSIEEVSSRIRIPNLNEYQEETERDIQTFEELSSIRRNPRLPEPRSEENQEVDSFIGNIN